MKEQLHEKSELEKKALRVVERLLEESVDEGFLIESVGFRESSRLPKFFISMNSGCPLRFSYLPFFVHISN